MRILYSVVAAILFSSAAMALPATTTDLSKAPSGAVPMETRHTEVFFSVLHAGPVDYYGRFDKVGGSINFDATTPEKSAVSVTVDTGSVNFKAPELVKDVTAKEVFDSAEFPQATFTSTAVTRTGPTTGTMTGDLTIKGITRPVTFAVTYYGSDGKGIGFHATTSIKRSDFNMTGMRFTGFISDEVRIIVDALFQPPRTP